MEKWIRGPLWAKKFTEPLAHMSVPKFSNEFDLRRLSLSTVLLFIQLILSLKKQFTDLAHPPNTFRLSAEAETILGELKVVCIFSEPPPAGLKFTGSATWACPSDG